MHDEMKKCHAVDVIETRKLGGRGGGTIWRTRRSKGWTKVRSKKSDGPIEEERNNNTEFMQFLGRNDEKLHKKRERKK